MRLHKRIRKNEVGSYADVRSQLCECSWGYNYCFWMGTLDPISKATNMADARVWSSSNGGILPYSI